MTKRSTLLDRLNEVHSFPGPYIFKVIGANSEDFPERVSEVTREVLEGDVEPNVSTRESSGGKHVSVTISVKVEEAEGVLDVYAALKELDEVRFIL